MPKLMRYWIQLTASIESAYWVKLAKEGSFHEFIQYLVTNEIKQQHEKSLTRLDEAKQKIEAGLECYKAFKEQCK